jgi:uncharacterized membrane protein
MTNGARFLLATLCGLAIASLVHLAVVFGLPWFAERDAFSRLRGTVELDRAELIVADGAEWPPRPDPAVTLAACAYDLAEGPVRISAKTGPFFQSLSFHARGSGVFYAVTDRAAVRGSLDLVVMTRAQLDEALAGEDEDDPSRDVRIVAPVETGLIVVRVLASRPSQRAEAEAVARSVSCVIEAGA